jgi:hypothetical protein
MPFDFNAAGGEAALLEQLQVGFDHRDRYSYPAASTATPTQNVTSNAITMSHSNRQSLSPVTSWLPLDMTGAVGAPLSIHSPNSGSVSASSPEDQGAQSPGHHSSNMSSPLQQQPSPFQTAARPNSATLITDWSLPLQAQSQQPTPELAQFMPDPTLMSFNPLVR